MICENSAKLMVLMMTASVSLMSPCISIDNLSRAKFDDTSMTFVIPLSVVQSVLSVEVFLNPFPSMPSYRCFRIITSFVQQSCKNPDGTQSLDISSHLAMARINVMQLVSASEFYKAKQSIQFSHLLCPGKTCLLL